MPKTFTLTFEIPDKSRVLDAAAEMLVRTKVHTNFKAARKELGRNVNEAARLVLDQALTENHDLVACAAPRITILDSAVDEAAPGSLPGQVDLINTLRDLLTPGRTSGASIEAGRDLLAKFGHDVRSLPGSWDQYLETPRMLVLSIGHISEHTNARLDMKVKDLLSQAERALLPIVYEKSEYGYVLPLIGEPEDRERWAAIPDLAAIRALAESVGATWIMLDRDGPVVDGLQTWEW